MPGWRALVRKSMYGMPAAIALSGRVSSITSGLIIQSIAMAKTMTK